MIERFERGDLSVTATTDRHVVLALAEDDPLGDGVYMTIDDFRWLVLTAGPALLAVLLAGPLPGTAAAEAKAGDGGGPPPAEQDATEPPDEQLEIAEFAAES